MPFGISSPAMMEHHLKALAKKVQADKARAQTENLRSIAIVNNENQTTKTTDKSLTDKFKQLDTDGDMHISKKELVDSAIKEYVKNGFEFNEGAIDDILADIANNVKEFGGDDGQLNIDEYRAMVEAQLKKNQTHQSSVDEITKIKEASKNNDTPPA